MCWTPTHMPEGVPPSCKPFEGQGFQRREQEMGVFVTSPGGMNFYLTLFPSVCVELSFSVPTGW